MADIFSDPETVPYIAGAAIGALSWIVIILIKKPIGCSTAYARTAGMIESVLRRKENAKVKERPYYQKFTPEIDWQWVFVSGILLGSFTAAVLLGYLQVVTVPEMWEDAFGDSVILRLVAALAGGIFVGFGARWAGGCTSGHGISGTMQLATSGWAAVLSFFASGIIAAFLLFEVIG